MTSKFSGFWEHEPIKCEGDAGWEGRKFFRVKQIVGHVDEVGPRRCDPGGRSDRLIDGEVRPVRAMAERVEDQCLDPEQVRVGVLGDFGGIGAVREGERAGVGWVIEPVPEDGEFAVHQGDGGDAEPEEFKWFVGEDDRGFERGDERGLDIRVRREDVLIHAPECVHCVFIREDGDGLALHFVESADLVEPESVIDVVVGEEDRVDPRDLFAEYLGTEIG